MLRGVPGQRSALRQGSSSEGFRRRTVPEKPSKRQTRETETGCSERNFWLGWPWAWCGQKAWRRSPPRITGRLPPVVPDLSELAMPHLWRDLFLAEELCRGVISLPMYAELSEEMVDAVCDNLL